MLCRLWLSSFSKRHMEGSGRIPFDGKSVAEDNMPLNNIAKSIFDAAVHSVLPRRLVLKHVHVKDDTLLVQQHKYKLKKNVYIVGFGKAVLGMAIAIDELLKDHIVEGVVSIPEGLQQSLKSSKYLSEHGILPPTSLVRVIEGAPNNIPDERSLYAAAKVEDLVRRIKEDDILITLISGGGSALLPSPVAGISLQEKSDVIQALARHGATIQELNVVRKKLSRLKGGKLPAISNSKQILSFIISDIIGDPLDLISSGPTVTDRSTFMECLNIVEKYEMIDRLPKSVCNYINSSIVNSNEKEIKSDNISHVQNVLIGTNADAIANCKAHAEFLGFQTFGLSRTLAGEASHIGKLLASFVWEGMFSKPDLERYALLSSDLEVLDAVNRYLQERRGKICILLSGETTVTVKGGGIGGRNQELALAASLEMDRLFAEHPTQCCQVNDWISILSAGTDGQDGPTPAAGAFFVPQIISKCEAHGIDASNFLDDNNSYALYRDLDEGQHHLVTGLTGTNVMDLQIILVDTAKLKKQ